MHTEISHDREAGELGQSVGKALRTPSEEFDAALTHGIGAFLAAIGSIYMVSDAAASGDGWRFVGCLLYAISLLGVLTASTLSHLYLPEHLNVRFRAYDQGFIYLLAAGSLSPFALTYLRTPFWMTFYAMSVVLAGVGFISKVMFAHRVDKISLWLYLALGWAQALAMIPLVDILPANALLWILAGALCYCIGIIFFVADVRRYRFHTIWHLLVMAGCACHYYAIYRFVVHQA